MADFSIEQLQAYIQHKRSEYISLTKPGYEVYFYSRYNKTADIITHIGSNASSVKDTIPHFASDGITPNVFFTSELAAPGVVGVRNIKIDNTVVGVAGSTAELTIAYPEGIDYFRQTIGHNGENDIVTDYDYSAGKAIPDQRIGKLDTVIIKLKNATVGLTKDTKRQSEIVFRGVIKSIHRVKSPGGGSTLILRLGDFSEILRNFTALPLGFFSTVSFSITGRGLVNNLIKYSNRLASGDWNFLNINYSGALSDIAKKDVEDFKAQQASADALLNQNIIPNADQAAQNTKSALNATNHKMDVPIFFYLEHSDQIIDIKAAVNVEDQDALNAGSVDPKDAPKDTSKDGGSPTSALQSVESSVYNNIINSLQAGTFQQTPEDQDTISSYQVAIDKSAGNKNLDRYSKSSDAGLLFIQGAEKYAWILSDLYLDKKLITFEHKRIWPTMTETAGRSMRECYFDFAPKLRQNAETPYDTAIVPNVRKNADLLDVHPSIGIIKYRLSPAMRSFDENGNSQIFQYSVSDDDILSVEHVEQEEEVFTAVFGFGSALDSASIAEKAKDIFVGANAGLAFAQSIDPRLESRLGYRFMTNHDQKVKIPILIYLTSYVALMQSQMNMFTAQVTVNGNPDYKPGSIVRLKDANIDYYCTNVIHDWSLQGYTTTLILSYGHTSGILPTPLSGGAFDDSIVSNEQCKVRSVALDEFIKKDVNIGGVNAHCLVSAMWAFMTCGASTDDAMKQSTPEYENSAPKTTKYSDWIEPYKWTPDTKEQRGYYNSRSHFTIPTGYKGLEVSSYIPIINHYITEHGLDKYNVTPNLVMNFIRRESAGFFADAYASDTGVGWFQLTTVSPVVNHQTSLLFTPAGEDAFEKEFGVSVQQAVINFDRACDAGLQLLLGKFKAVSRLGCTGDSFLRGLGAYNGDVSANHKPYYTYQRDVLGSEQVDRIATESQLPKGAKGFSINSGISCRPQGEGLKQWPHPVYGPIGQRLDAYKKRHPGIKDEDAKKDLNTFKIGMTEAANYIVGLLKFYQDHDLANLNGQNQTALIHANSLLEKVVVAWFSNEDINSLHTGDAAVLDIAIKGITQAYQDCQNCTGQTATALVGEDYGKNVALSQIDFRYPCSGNETVTSPFGPRSLGVGAGPYHLGIDIGATEFFSCADGEVVSVDNFGYSAGYQLVILHSDKRHGICTRFLDMNLPVVKTGQKVSKGQFLGTADGSTRESGPHIHVELRFGVPFSSGGAIEQAGTEGATHVEADGIHGGHFSGIAVDPVKYFKRV